MGLLGKKLLGKKKLPIGVLGFILYVASVVAICCPPLWARRTYVSENALLPGGAQVRFSHSEMHTANTISRQWLDLNKKDLQGDKASAWVEDVLKEYGLESYRHDFLYQKKVEGLPEVARGRNIYSIVRAKKATGTESIVLAARFNRRIDNRAPNNAVISLGMSISLLKYFSEQNWLAKDIILVLTDESQAPEIALRSWLESYLGLPPKHRNLYNSSFVGDLPARSGNIQAALNIDIIPSEHTRGLTLSIAGANGQLPNLDLINTIVRTGNYRGISDDDVHLPGLPAILVAPVAYISEQFIHFAREILPLEYLVHVTNPPSVQEFVQLYGQSSCGRAHRGPRCFQHVPH